MKKENLLGRRFGRLTVTAATESSTTGQARWICRCDCGQETVVFAGNLRRNHTTSCGCYGNEKQASGRRKTHGMRRTRLYRIWSGILSRCTCETNPAYPRYGGRGITLYAEWRKFENFLEWAVMSGYSDVLSIDRVDVNGGYNPENCRWATNKEQANNTRGNRLLEHGGKTMTVTQWAEEVGIDSKTLFRRLDLGWEAERAIITPVKQIGGQT